jgi:hypothetical protein
MYLDLATLNDVVFVMALISCSVVLNHIFLTDESGHLLEMPQSDFDLENQFHRHDVTTEVKFHLNLYRNYIHGIMHFVYTM